MTLLIVKGACICSLFHKIHYIKIRYIEVLVYLYFVCSILDATIYCMIGWLLPISWNSKYVKGSKIVRGSTIDQGV